MCKGVCQATSKIQPSLDSTPYLLKGFALLGKDEWYLSCKLISLYGWVCTTYMKTYPNFVKILMEPLLTKVIIIYENWVKRTRVTPSTQVEFPLHEHTEIEVVLSTRMLAKLPKCTNDPRSLLGLVFCKYCKDPTLNNMMKSYADMWYFVSHWLGTFNFIMKCFV